MVYHKLRKFLLIRLIKINSDFITISKETTLVPSGKFFAQSTPRWDIFANHILWDMRSNQVRPHARLLKCEGGLIIFDSKS